MLANTDTMTSQLESPPPLKLQRNATPGWFIALIVLAALVFVLGLILVIVGAVKSSTLLCAASQRQRDTTCDWSAEANRLKLFDYFTKVQETYFKMAPYQIAWHPRIRNSEKRQVLKER